MPNYKLTAAALAAMVSELAESLADAYSAAEMDEAARPYPAERTKYDDRPLQLVPPLPAEPPAKPTYALPYPPPLEHRVVDTNGRRWVHGPNHGIFVRVLGHSDTDGWETPAQMDWASLLASYGPLTLDEWTDEERAGFELYGPPGARWGDPSQECSHYACSLGHGHVGLHHDAEGNPIEPPPADGSTVDAGITPHESSQTPCTCGHPDRHRPDCPRYTRTSGVETDTTEYPDAMPGGAFTYTQRVPTDVEWTSRNDEQRDFAEEAANDKLSEED